MAHVVSDRLERLRSLLAPSRCVLVHDDELEAAGGDLERLVAERLGRPRRVADIVIRMHTTGRGG